MNAYNGQAIRLDPVFFATTGVSKDAEGLCNVAIEEVMIRRGELVCPFLNKLVVVLLKIFVFCSNALGVRHNQYKIHDAERRQRVRIRRGYVGPNLCGIRVQTWRLLLLYLPGASLSHGCDLARFSYTRLVQCLTYRYTLTSCPSHLTRAGFDNLEAKNANATSKCSHTPVRTTCAPCWLVPIWSLDGLAHARCGHGPPGLSRTWSQDCRQRGI